MVSEKKATCIIYGVGAFCLVVGIGMGAGWPFIYDEIFKNLLVLTKSSYMYSMWTDPPLDAYLEGYLFNWTNWKEVEADPTVKPNFEEVGPFVFKEVHSKEGVSWNEDDTIITFNGTRTWFFVPEESADMSLEVTTLNPLSTAVTYMARVWPSKFWQTVINALMNKHESYFATAPVQQWLFDGLDDSFLEILNNFRNLTYIPIPLNKMGWFYGRNGSADFDGIWTMKTGVDDIYNLGMVDSWNYMKNTSYYNGDCNLVRGDSGEIMPPFKDGKIKQTSMSFASDLCSTMTLYLKGETDVEGVKAYEYVGDENTFDNGQLVPENACFCTGECTPSGARNISLCRYGMPAFVSLPHFYGADPSYTENITGMNPNYEDHTIRFKLQPDVGMPVEARGMMQLNMLVQPLEQFDMFRNSPRHYIPMLWFKQRGRISSDLGILLNLFILMPYIGMGIFFGIALIGLLSIVIRFIIIKRRKKSFKIY